MASLSAYVVQHPSVYLYVAPVFGLAALSATPPLIPLVLLLTTLHLHVHTFLPRRMAGTHGVAQVILLSMAASITHFSASVNALSTPTVSVVVLWSLSALTAFVALFTIGVSFYANRFARTPWSKLTLFPAVWATAWAAVSHISPVGRLITWSPVTGLGMYGWLRPVFGQWGLDWVVAAWAVVFADTIGRWLVGSPHGDFDDTAKVQEPVDLIGSEDALEDNQISQRAPSLPYTTRHILTLTCILALLSAPSFFIPNLPVSTISTNAVTSLKVGCALPDPRQSGHQKHAPTLDDFISETKTLQSSADIILWPEGAVKFETTSQKETTFKDISGWLQDKHLVGVSFEEFTLSPPSDGWRSSGMRRNGFALLSKEGSVLEYYKRKLVPIAESFSLTPSSDPPAIFEWELAYPNNWSKTKWGLNGTRSIPITASICLDFSSASSFEALASRPALVLAPARTWHTGVGYAMWEQARARAEELGSMVLWCDGGDGGVSGIAGGGLQEIVQVGQGSWSRRIGVQYPFDQGRTLFSRGGGFAALVTAWGIVGVGSVLDVILLKLRAGGRDHQIGRAWVLRRINGIGETSPPSTSSTQVACKTSLPGSLRASAKLFASSSSSSLSPYPGQSASRKALVPVPEEHLALSDPWADDFEQISYDELRASLLLCDASALYPGIDSQTPPSPSLLNRSRSSFARLRKLSRLSLKKSRQSFERSPEADSSLTQTHTPAPDQFALVLTPHPTSPARYSSSSHPKSPSRTSPVEDSFSAFYDSDPFRKVESPTEFDVPEFRTSFQAAGERLAADPEPHPPPSPRPRVVVPSSTGLDSSSTRTTSHKPLKRLKSFAKLHLLPSSRKTTSEAQSVSADETPEDSPARLPTVERLFPVDDDLLPELSFDRLDFSTVFDENSTRLSTSTRKNLPSLPEAVETSDPDLANYLSNLQVFRYQRVDPRDLTASARTSTVIGFSPTATPLPPPSPSWLSRNVKDLEFYAEETPLPIPPPSPPPLPILPRSLLPVPSRLDTESYLCTDPWDVPESPRSTASSVTLYSPSCPASPVESSPCSRLRPPSLNRLSVIHYRRSLVDRHSNVRSIIEYGSIAYAQYQVPSTPEPSRRSSLNFLLLSPGPQELTLPPLALFDSDHPPPSPSDNSNLPSPSRLSSTATYRIFLPSRQASLDCEPDHLPIPDHLLAIAKRISQDSQALTNMSMNALNKSAPTVDWGDEVDYSGYEWFKDPPQKPEPVPPSVMENYVPPPAVVEQNEMFDFALKSAPNVLYARYKQYGQLGVLAWCSEFSELIDALKTLGFDGNMFVSTRTQALRACEDILKLKLKIEMQIIVMYLSSQIQRLRRFLDGDGHWDDYPELNFPLDPRAY
ncbi:uncharacterized protein FIBRA_06369 [Fibroporia radiculosa]|uniref:CN hydrolase domain-containing protein n=1 Tax=Fibroporia radiculosa TaxID=599839 RepID=J4GBA1_9APHY|nr:uncharacterized protein FIBRA_06369 [Fibroporia radiculosa]CCM04203.1 predicted protein [Fibroporia radiculosa]